MGFGPPPQPTPPPEVVQNAANAVQNTGEAITDATEDIVDEVTQTGDEASENAEETQETAEDAASDVSNELRQIAQVVDASIIEAGQKLYQDILDPVQEIGSGMQQVFKLAGEMGKDGRDMLQDLVPLSFMISVVVIVAEVLIGAIAMVIGFLGNFIGMPIISSIVSILGRLIGIVNQNSAKATGKAKEVLDSTNATLHQIMAILERLNNASNKKRARKIALMELSQALQSARKITSSLKNVSGYCKVDLKSAFRNLQKMDTVLRALITFIQRKNFAANRNNQAALNALSQIRRGLADATNTLQLGVTRLKQKNQFASGNQRSGLPGFGGTRTNQTGGQNINFPNSGGSNSFKVN